MMDQNEHPGTAAFKKLMDDHPEPSAIGLMGLISEHGHGFPFPEGMGETVKPRPHQERRLGRFFIGPPDDLRKNWDKFLPLFAQVVVVQCSYCFASDAIEYMAYSPAFDIAPEGLIPPVYDVIATQFDGGRRGYVFERRGLQ